MYFISITDTVCEEGCKDINECERGLTICDENGDNCVTSSACHPNANCTNTPGGFLCECRDGYTGNGRWCQGKDSVFS